ncbi:hypothetical protein AOC06_05275 [Polynucleobacter paludilacus]|nr:hypothetical protein AOC06_05275 [Polynucleobacter paludilacus]
MDQCTFTAAKLVALSSSPNRAIAASSAALAILIAVVPRKTSPPSPDAVDLAVVS